MTTPICYVRQGLLSFADKILIKDLECYLYSKDKIALVGNNGSGKSSLFKVIAGYSSLTKGDFYLENGMKIGYLEQNIILPGDLSAEEYILNETSCESYQANIFLHKLKIPAYEIIDNLSGGQKRRLLLAKILSSKPDILLLDEPNNHLDIDAIEWLEEYLLSYQGSVICISHDRKFLENITNTIWYIDRGVFYTSKRGFKYFDSFQEEIMEEEQKRLMKLNKKLQLENQWFQQGVTGRRKRNQGRLSHLHKLREQIQERKQRARTMKADQLVESEVKKTRFIIEAEKVNFSYQEGVEMIKDFSFRVVKGEKIALVGPNGSGKSTLLKILLKQMMPISGKVIHGSNLDISYFDQNKSCLDLNLNVLENLCPNGGYYVNLSGKILHAAAYLKQLMFDPKLLHTKLSILSGGQQSRLALAYTLINKGNLLILDEPTNDLDMDSLDILLEILHNYQGTLIVVSHDRYFIDNLVERTLIINKNGEILDILGNYQDYIAMKKKQVKPAQEKISPKLSSKKKKSKKKLAK